MTGMMGVGRLTLVAVALLLSAAGQQLEPLTSEQADVLLGRIEPAKARAMLKEIFAALTSEQATVAIAAIAPAADGQGAGAKGMSERLTAVLPIAEGLAGTVCAKYGFEGGLQDAMRAAEQAGERSLDKKLFDAMQRVTEIISGQASPRSIGRVAELDALADGFVALDAAGRAEAVNKAEAVLEGFGDTASAATYLEAMRGIIANGDDFALDTMVKAIVRLGPSMDDHGAKSTNTTKRDLHVRINVLAEFLTPDDHARIDEKLEAAMNGASAGEEL